MFMERWDVAYRALTSCGGAAALYFFGGWSALLGVLLTFVVVDYVSGVLAAWTKGELSSQTGVIGIAKKVFIFAMVAVAHLVDTALGELHLFRDATVFFYLANELLSIIENSGRMGLPIPETIKQAVEILKGKGGIK